MLLKSKSPPFYSMGTMAIRDPDEEELKDKEVLILMSISTFSLVTTNGEFLVAAVSLHADQRPVNALKSFQLRENKFLIAEEQTILTGYIAYYKSEFKQQLKFENKIQEVFLDTAIHRRYLGVLTYDQVLHIAAISNVSCKLCHTFTLPNFSFTSLSFFYPGINSSPRNKHKDRVYAVFQGMPISKYVLTEKPSKKAQETLPINPKALYIYEFKESFLGDTKELLKLKPMDYFYVDSVGIAKNIFFNENDLNCIRVLSE